MGELRTIMGRGLAAQFKPASPANVRAYEAGCKPGDQRPGRMDVFELTATAQPQWAINFPSQRHWREKSRIEDIRSGLVALVAEVRDREIRSNAIPPLGGGLGGLDWAP